MLRPDVPVEILQTLSSFLKSKEMANLWAQQNASRADDNPAHTVATHIDALLGMRDQFPHLASNNTTLLSFARHFLEYERTALKKAPAKNTVEKARFEKIDLMAGTLRDILPDEQLIPEENLIADYRETLEAVGHSTALRFKPLVALKRAFGHLADHFNETVRRMPKTSAAIGTVLLPTLFWLGAEGMSAKNATVKIQVAETCTTNLSASDIAQNGFTFGDSDVSSFGGDLDLQSCNVDLESCHDNLKTTFPGTVAFMERQGITIPAIPHCLMVNNMAHKTQNIILGADALLKAPYFAVMDGLVNDPMAQAESTSIFEGSHFLNGAQKIAGPLQEGIYYANRIENSIHPLLFFISLSGVFMMMIRAQKMDSAEWSELRNSIVDFTTRAYETRLLVYATPAAAIGTYLTIHGYDTSGSFIDSNLIALTTFGATAGYLLHKFGVNLTGANKHHAMRLSQNAGDVLQNFQSDALPLSVQKQMEQNETNGSLRTKILLGSGLYTSIVAGDLSGAFNQLQPGMLQDLAINAAESAGMIPVAAAIIGAFLPYNFLIEDPAQHIVFIGGGSATGAALALTGITVVKALNTSWQFKNHFAKATLATALLTSPLEGKMVTPLENEHPTILIMREHESRSSSPTISGP